MIELIPATRDDYPLLQNLGRFYEYEMARYCGWPWVGEDGGFPSQHLQTNFKRYFEQPDRHLFIVKIDAEIAGFALINKIGTRPTVDWNMGEFFILAKFQGKSIGGQVAHLLWQQFPGTWETAVMPDNIGAYHFWQKTVAAFTKGIYAEAKHMTREPEPHLMVILRLCSPPATIRHATLEDAEQITHVHVQAWQQSYQGIIDADHLANISYEYRLEIRKQSLQCPDTVCFVATVGDQIVGFCNLGPSRDKSSQGGEVYSLYLLQSFKGLGLGVALWNAAKEYFLSQGFTSFHVWVLKDNHPARQFYERQGGILAAEQQIEIGDKMYDEVGYVFHLRL